MNDKMTSGEIAKKQAFHRRPFACMTKKDF